MTVLIYADMDVIWIIIEKNVVFIVITFSTRIFGELKKLNFHFWCRNIEKNVRL